MGAGPHLRLGYFLDVWQVLLDFRWRQITFWHHIWDRRWRFLLSAALLLQEKSFRFIPRPSLALTEGNVSTRRRCGPPVYVWPAPALCCLWLVSSPSPLRPSSCSPHPKPWQCSRNEPSVFLHLCSLWRQRKERQPESLRKQQRTRHSGDLQASSGCVFS